MNEPGIDLAQRVGAQAEPFGGAGGQVLDEHIGGLGERLDRGKPLLGFEVEGDGFLAPVQPDEMAGHALDRFVVAAGEVTDPGPLDLDDAGAEIGELTGGERRGDGLFEGDDGDSRNGVMALTTPR